MMSQVVKKSEKQEPGKDLSAEELRKRLYSKFREQGVLDGLKSQLRNKLVHELDVSNISPKERNVQIKGESPLLIQMTNWLVADHLRMFEFHYTLSVFVAESRNLNGTENLFTFDDVLVNLLRIPPESKVYSQLSSLRHMKNDASLLYNFLRLLSDFINGGRKSKQDQSVQTNEEANSAATGSTIRQKLQSVEDLYVVKKGAMRLELENNVEVQLLKYKQSLEMKLRNESKTDLQNFKESELVAMKLEERDKCRLELKNKRKELDREHRAKLEALVERERRGMEEMAKLRESLQRETFNQRQEVLAQLDSARHQELEARRLVEKYQSDAELEKQRLEAMSQKISMKENVLVEKEQSIDSVVRNLVAEQRLCEQEEHATKMKELTRRELEIQSLRDQLEADRAKCVQQMEEATMAVARKRNLERQLEESQTAEKLLQNQNLNLEEDLRYARGFEKSAADLQATRQSVMQLTAERDRLVDELRQLKDRLARPSIQEMNLKRDLERERDGNRLDHAMWLEQRKRLEIQLTMALDNNKTLSSKSNERIQLNAHLMHTVQNLREQLHYAQAMALRPQTNRNPIRIQSTPANLNAFRDDGHNQTTPFVETFFDTSLSASHLAPELELHGDSPSMFVTPATECDNTMHHEGDDFEFGSLDPSFRRRIAALEREAEELERRFNQNHNDGESNQQPILESYPYSRNVSVIRREGKSVQFDYGPITPIVPIKTCARTILTRHDAWTETEWDDLVTQRNVGNGVNGLDNGTQSVTKADSGTLIREVFVEEPMLHSTLVDEPELEEDGGSGGDVVGSVDSDASVRKDDLKPDVASCVDIPEEPEIELQPEASIAALQIPLSSVLLPSVNLDSAWKRIGDELEEISTPLISRLGVNYENSPANVVSDSEKRAHLLPKSDSEPEELRELVISAGNSSENVTEDW